MDPSKDNPLIRFRAFIWGIGIFSLFAVTFVAIAIFKGKASPYVAEDAAATPRYDTKKKVDAAQTANFSYKEVEAGKIVQVPPNDVFAHVGGMLAAFQPSAVEKPEQIVPGSATQKKMEEAAKTAAPIDVAEGDANAPIDPAVMAAGQATFALCMACHGMNGEGGPIAPPLANSEWVTGPVSNPIRIVLRGLGGPISVAGKDYNFPAPMGQLSSLSDDQVAAVLTYARNSWGNKASAVTADQVKAFRGEVGLPVLQVSDLKAPK
jgi:mono/diheme cytochrome c family protein